LRLPPLVRDLEIDYTALSLVAPEKIRFRIKLEGRDSDWKDVGNERKSFIIRSVSAAEYCWGAFTLPASPPLFQSGQFMCELDRTDHILATGSPAIP
jgi:hypothetical protein